MNQLQAIIVDDELLALKNLEVHLRAIGGIEIVGSYQNPQLAYEAICQSKPDIVFLDIEMPVLTGIELADKLHDIVPDTSVVFITAYNMFAIQAFELNAVDYILKPIIRNRLEKTITRILRRYKDSSIAEKKQPSKLPYPILIRCFQSLQIEYTGEPSVIKTFQWKTSKAQEVFAYFLYQNNQPVRKDYLIDQFFPNVDYNRGSTQLYTTIYQIRKALREYRDILSLQNCIEGWQLYIYNAHIDSVVWENGLRKHTEVTEENFFEHQQLLSLYRGDYLEIYDYIWAEPEKERLRSLCISHLAKFVDYYLAKNDYTNGILLLKRMQAMNPYHEDSYFKLMRIYAILQDHAAVKEQYHQLQAMLDSEYNEQPPNNIQKWYDTWINP